MVKLAPLLWDKRFVGSVGSLISSEVIKHTPHNQLPHLLNHLVESPDRSVQGTALRAISCLDEPIKKQLFYNIVTERKELKCREYAIELMLEGGDKRAIPFAHEVLNKQRGHESERLLEPLIGLNDQIAYAKAIDILNHYDSEDGSTLLQSILKSNVRFGNGQKVFQTIAAETDNPVDLSCAIGILAFSNPNDPDAWKKVRTHVKDVETFSTIVSHIERHPTPASLHFLEDYILNTADDKPHMNTLGLERKNREAACLRVFLDHPNLIKANSDLEKALYNPDYNMREVLSYLVQKDHKKEEAPYAFGTVGKHLGSLAIEEKNPSLFDLYKRALGQGIRNPYRYSPELLESIVKERETPFIDVRPLAVVMMPRADWNGGFISTDKTIGKLFNQGFKVMVYEWEKDSELGHTIASATLLQKYQLLVIGGHGSQQEIAGGASDPRITLKTTQSDKSNKAVSIQGKISEDELVFSKKDVRKFTPLHLSSCGVPGSQVIAWSCSAGQGGEKTRDNTLHYLSEIFSSSTDFFGPQVSTALKELVFDPKDKKRIVHVKYYDDTAHQSVELHLKR